MVYKHFDRSLHVGSTDPTCLQNIRPVTLTVFEILGFKLKKSNDDNKERIGDIHISHVNDQKLGRHTCSSYVAISFCSVKSGL